MYKKNNNNIFIISGPSGAGEDSIIDGLKKYFPIERITTTTTRKMRPGESQKNPYYFISKEEFKEGIKKGSFFEYAEEDNNNFYGVTHEEISRVKEGGNIVIWKIDYKGVISAKKLMPEALSILIDVPLDIIEKRIRKRNEVAEEFVKSRLEYAKGWYENRHIFDYIIKNKEGKLNEAIEAVKNIIEQNKLKK